MSSLAFFPSCSFLFLIFLGKRLGAMKGALASGAKPDINSVTWDVSFNLSGLVCFSGKQRSKCLLRFIGQRLCAGSPSGP